MYSSRDGFEWSVNQLKVDHLIKFVQGSLDWCLVFRNGEWMGLVLIVRI